jgi:hypothetical protein
VPRGDVLSRKRFAEALLTSFPEVRKVAVPGGTGYRGVKIRDRPIAEQKERGRTLKEDVENWAASYLEVRGDAVTFLSGEEGLLASYKEYLDSVHSESPANLPDSEPGRDRETLHRSTRFRNTLDAILKALEPAVVEKIHFSGHVVYRGVGLKEAVGNGTERKSGGDATKGTLWAEETRDLSTSRETGAEKHLYTEKDEAQGRDESEIPQKELVGSANGRDSRRDATDGADLKDETSVPSSDRARRLETVEITKEGEHSGSGEVGDSEMPRKMEDEDAPLELGSGAGVRYSETSRYGGTVGDSETSGKIERDADLPENEPSNDDLSNGRSGRELVGDKVSTQSEGEQLQERIQPENDVKEGRKEKAFEGGQLTPFSLWNPLCSLLVVSFKIRCGRYLHPTDSDEPSKASSRRQVSAENNALPPNESARAIAEAAYEDAVRQAEVTSAALRAAARALAREVADAVSDVGYLEEKMQELEGDTRAFRESVEMLEEVRELLGEESEEEEGVSGEKNKGSEEEEEAGEKSRILKNGAGEKVGEETRFKSVGRKSDGLRLEGEKDMVQVDEKEQVRVKKQEGEAGKGDRSRTERARDTWPLGDALAGDTQTLEEALRVAEESPYVVQAADIALAAADLEMIEKE